MTKIHRQLRCGAVVAGILALVLGGGAAPNRTRPRCRSCRAISRPPTFPSSARAATRHCPWPIPYRQRAPHRRRGRDCAPALGGAAAGTILLSRRPLVFRRPCADRDHLLQHLCQLQGCRRVLGKPARLSGRSVQQQLYPRSRPIRSRVNHRQRSLRREPKGNSRRPIAAQPRVAGARYRADRTSSGQTAQS